MIKNGLFINNKKVDVDDDQLFLFTYSNNDVVDPQAVKNNYSKTITLKGTSNNNKVLGNIWKLDQSVNVFFNKNDRELFELYDNGNLIESGYVQLNSVKYVKNNCQYEITLYGMLGDFFYNLMCDSALGNELTLADLLYNCGRLNTTLGESSEFLPEYVEDVDETKSVFNWNKNFIWNSWLLQFTDIYPKRERMLWEDIITAAPVYNGVHDDFDNDVILTNLNYPAEYDNILPPNQTIDGRQYSKKLNYAKVKVERDFDEWEIRDLRSLFQRPAIRLANLFKIISEYSKSKGYEIVWDKDIDLTGQTEVGKSILNDYYWKSYIMLNPMDFETEQNNVYQLKADEVETSTTGLEWEEVWLKNNITGEEVFDCSNLDNAQVDIFLNERFNSTDQNRKAQVNGGKVLYTSGYNKKNDKFREFPTSIFGAFVYHVEVYDGDDKVNEIVYLVEGSSNEPNFNDNQQLDFNNAVYKWINDNISSPISYDGWTLLSGKLINAMAPGSSDHFITFENDVNIKLYNLPKSNNVRIKINKGYCSLIYYIYGSGGYIYNYRWIEPEGEIKTGRRLIADGIVNGTKLNIINSRMTDFSSTQLINNSTSYIFIPSNEVIVPTYVNKSILFANTSSPFKYLIDWCKLFNLRFRTDIRTKRIFIEQRKNYFINEVVNINDKIDYSKDFKIDPTFFDERVYRFKLEEDDSYAHYIYSKVNNSDYSTMDVDTGYKFNNEVKDIFEDNVFRTNIDYLLKSPYFNTTKVMDGIQYPIQLLMPVYDYYLWHDDECKEVRKFGMQSYFNIPTIEDNFTKQCLFDDEQKTVDVDNSIVFFDGLWKMPQVSGKYYPYFLTDNIQIMQELNDDKACYLNAYYDNSIIPYNEVNYWMKRHQMGVVDSAGGVGEIGLWSFFVPKFHSSLSMNNKYYISYNFKNPDKYYGSTQYDSNSSLYSRYWKDYIGDLINIETKIVECSVLFEEKDISEMLRKFYYFNNTLWILEKIEDYNYKGKSATKCRFVKVNNKNNYIE